EEYFAEKQIVNLIQLENKEEINNNNGSDKEISPVSIKRQLVIKKHLLSISTVN
ncbi:15885_t:CDS:1, partial [Funneliformis geosporum]